MLRRTLKVIAVAAAIVFVPYFIGHIAQPENDFAKEWLTGLVCFLVFTGVSVLIGMLGGYILKGK